LPALVPHRASPRPLVVGLALLAGLLLLYRATLAPGLTWAHDSADGGDLIAAAATGGVAHPTGYPTYLLLARAWLALPLGPLAARANLFSALCAALSAAVLAGVTAGCCPGPPRRGLAAGLLAGAAFGLSPLLWSQAVVTEVYALHALGVTLILWTLPLAPPPGLEAPWRSRLAGLIFGLALGNHATTALLLPPWLAAAARQDGRWQPRALANRLLGLAAGLCVYLYLPLSAAGHPPVNWGAPSSWEGFWWLVSGGGYRDMAFGLPGAFVLGRVQSWAALLIRQFGWLGLAAAAYGLFMAPARGVRVKAVTGWLALSFSIFAIGYNTADSYAYLLPAFAAAATWLGLGAAAGLDAAARLRPASARRLARLAGAGGLAAALMLNAAAQWPRVDASRSVEAERYGRAVLADAPPAALIFTHGDRDTFALWYLHIALTERPDVAVIVEPLLGFPWYRDSLRRHNPGLVVADEAAAGWRAALAADNARAVCDTAADGSGALACAPAGAP
jgi:hypothetical protein